MKRGSPMKRSPFRRNPFCKNPFRKKARKVRFGFGPSRKSPRQLLIKALDDLFSFFIRLRDKKYSGNICRICGKRPIEVCYHILPKVSTGHVLRWDPDNAVGSCSPCNGAEYWHRLKYADKHIELFGRKFYNALKARARKKVKYSMADLREIKLEIQRKIEGL